MTPDHEGFFWARWLKAVPGTDDNGDGCPGPELADWEVVNVFENGGDPDNADFYMVAVAGVAKGQSLDCFEWGEEVVREAA